MPPEIRALLDRIDQALHAAQIRHQHHARDIAGLRQEIQWLLDGHIDGDLSALEADIERNYACAEPMPDWPAEALYDADDPSPFRDTDELATGVQARPLRQWRQDEQFWPAALQWGQQRDLIDAGQADVLSRALAHFNGGAKMTLVKLQLLAMKVGREDLYFAGSPEQLVAWGVQSGHITQARADEIWQALGAAAMRWSGP